MALIQQGVGNILLRFWSILTWYHHAVAADLSAARPWCKSPVPPHPKGALLDWDLVTVEAIWVKWTYRHVQETSLRWFELCDMLHYPAGSSHQKMVHCSHKGMSIGQQQYSGRLWRLNDAQLEWRPQSVPRKYPPHITPPPAWTIETRQDGSMLLCSLRQILTLPSECRSRNQDSWDQAMFFSIFYCPILVSLCEL